MAQQPLPAREPSKRIRLDNCRYPSRVEPTRSARSAAAGPVPVKLERSVPSFDNDAQELRSLQRSQAQLTALLQQSGCTSAVELGMKYAAMERKLMSIDATSEEEDGEDEEKPKLWVTLQNCRGVTKQKPDDRYLQCMGLNQKVRTMVSIGNYLDVL